MPIHTRMNHPLVGREEPDVVHRARFTAALVERYLASVGADPTSALLIEDGMLTGRHRARKPPVPLQQPETFYSGLSSVPWHDPAQFDWVAGLEDRASAIREELSDLLGSGCFSPVQLSGELATQGSWRELRLYTDGRREAAADLAPVTAAAVARVPGATSAGLVYAAAVTAGTHIRPHWGPHNARLRVHLGVQVPPGCAMRVGEEIRTWQEGRVLVFDDSFEHEVWNDGVGTRVVLILDIWHPDLGVSDIAAIRYSTLPFMADAYAVAARWRATGDLPSLGSPASSRLEA